MARMIYYCRNCNKTYSDNPDVRVKCTSCNNILLQTNITADLWHTKTDDEKQIQKRKWHDKEEIYFLDGGVGDQLYVYDDHVVLKHNGIVNMLSMGLKGEKTLYYSDITSVQYKRPGITSGYIQFSIPGGNENTAGVLGAVRDENTITIGNYAIEQAGIIVEYINEKIREIKAGKNVVSSPISSADEIRKFKELLDMGAITQEEYDSKKKQLLGL